MAESERKIYSTASNIKASVISLENGFEYFENVNSIKIVSKGYNLLIMEDYLPVIGEIDGEVIIYHRRGEKSFKNIKAYYKHSHNLFKLLIKEQSANNDRPSN